MHEAHCFWELNYITIVVLFAKLDFCFKFQILPPPTLGIRKKSADFSTDPKTRLSACTDI